MDRKVFSILIADDDPDEIELLKILFEKHLRFEVVGCVSNGEEIISFLKNVPRKPDVILTDMYMPRMNAIETLDALMAQGDFNDLHLIIISTTINQSNVEKFKNVNKISFLKKAVTYYEYKALPENVLEIIS